MKKKFTFLIAAYAALMLIFLPGTVKGQTKGYTQAYQFKTTQSSSNTGYASNYNITVSGIGWSCPGNQNFNGYVRIGGKEINNVDRYIYSKTAIQTSSPYNITKITVNHGGKSNNAVIVNSVKIIVASDSEFSTVIEEKTLSPTPTFSFNTDGSFDITPSENKTWTSAHYYKFIFNITKSTTGNAGIDIKNITFYKTQYDVTYDCNGGTSGCPSNQTVNEGQTITLPNAPTKDNYDFDGWKLESTTYDPGDSYTVNSDVTFVAQWTATGPIKLATPTNFAATPGNEQATFSWDAVEHASNYTIFAKNGPTWDNPTTLFNNVSLTNGQYVGTGLTNGTTYVCKVRANGDGTYYSNSDLSDEINVTPTDATIYNVNVVSSLTGGSVSASPLLGESGTTITLTATPSTGYTFNNLAGNWSVTDSGDNPVSVTPGDNNKATFTLTDHVNVSATFTPYTVTLNAGTGTVNGQTTDTWDVSMNSGNLPDAVSPNSDWSFGGWSTTPVTTSTTETQSYVATAYTPTSNTTLYAVYTKTTNDDVETTLNVADYADEHGWKNETAYFEAVVSPITFTVSGTGNNGKYYSSNDSWRLYTSGNGAMTITATGNNVYAVSSTPSKTFTITNGEAYHAVTSNTQFTSITVTTRTTTTSYYSNPRQKVATPSFSVAEGSYADIQTITIDCETNGATIYYTTDGTDPTTSSTVYSSAITVDETINIKAIAVKADMDNSDVASATYTITTLFTMQGIFNAAGAESATVNIKFNGWVVSGKTTNKAFVTDGTKGFVIDQSSHGFVVGNTLTSSSAIECTLVRENGYAKISGITSSTTGLTVDTGGTVSPADIAISDLSGVNTGALLHYDNLACTSTGSGNSIRWYLGSLQVYGTLFSSYASSLTANHDYNITGVYQQYNSTKEILPRSAADIVEVEYNITVTQPASGGTISSNKTTAKYGESVTLTASAAANYRFSSWTVMNGETPVTVEDNQFTMPKGNVTVTATFVPTYAIEFAAMSNGSVSATPNPAIEGEDVTLTIDPDDGFALQSIRAYKKGDTETPVTIDANNQFTMPAYAVTVEATFSVEYTVTYKANGGTGDDIEVKYGAGANVIVAANTFSAPAAGKIFECWNTQADGQGDDYDPADVIEDILANIDLYAKWRNIVYHITYNVNGEESTPVDVNYGQSITTLPTASLSPLTFLGWSTEATGPVNVTAPYTPTGTTENITLYAVFGSTGIDAKTITPSTADFATSGYNDGSFTIGTKSFSWNQLAVQSPYGNQVIQFAKDGAGILQNTNDGGVIISIIVTYYNGSGANGNRNISILAGETISTVTQDVEFNNDDNIYTFTFPTNCKYFVMTNNDKASQVASISINYESISSVTITNIKTTESLSEIPDNTSIMVKNGGILTFTGTNSNPQNLIVEDGGQLIIPSSGSKTDVKATFQKEITAYTEENGKDNYYLIANPTTDVIDPATVAGMVEDDVDDEDEFDYDLYYFDEAQPKAEWRNYRQGGGFNLVNGKGYLYAKSSDITLEFPGTVPPGTTADITLSRLGSGTYAGFNLVGNPLSNNVTTMKIAKGLEEKSCSYYKVNSSTGVFEVSTAPIIVGEAFMVQAPNDWDGAILKLNQGSKGEDGFNNEVIRLEVSNSKFTDVAYVYFGNHLPLTKISHLNDEAPMLYIHNENSDRAVEVYSNRGEVKSINVNFEAKTMGTYTISAKMVKGEIKYMHLYDRLTGIDTDLLVDDYSFIGTKDDQPGRFILNLESVDDNGSSTGSETFAYQSGDNIIVNGEGELQVFDVTGRMVMSQRVNGAQIVNGLNTGVYVFRMEGKVQKVVIR